MMESHELAVMLKEKKEAEYERKINECYKRLDELFGETCDKIIIEADRLASIDQIDSYDVVQAFIADKFFIKVAE